MGNDATCYSSTRNLSLGALDARSIHSWLPVHGKVPCIFYDMDIDTNLLGKLGDVQGVGLPVMFANVHFTNCL